MDKETRERRRVVMECVEGMLGANPELRRIAQLVLATQPVARGGLGGEALVVLR
jgi:hypothetical protein